MMIFGRKRLRDKIAIEAMKSEINAWNSELSDDYREGILKYIIDTYGNVKVADGIAKMSYDMADAMLRARK